MNRQTGWASIFMLTGFVLLAASGHGGMQSNRLLSPGDKAPDLSFADVQTGAMTPFEALGRQRPLVVLFLQTACRSCYHEILTLKKLQKELDTFAVFGVFLDMKAKDFGSYIKEHKLPFTFAWDSNYAIAEAYGVSFTPASFVLDRDRKIVSVHRGFRPGMAQDLRSDIERLGGKR
jgi:peroxiredoxin